VGTQYREQWISPALNVAPVLQSNELAGKDARKNVLTPPVVEPGVAKSELRRLETKLSGADDDEGVRGVQPRFLALPALDCLPQDDVGGAFRESLRFLVLWKEEKERRRRNQLRKSVVMQTGHATGSMLLGTRTYLRRRHVQNLFKEMLVADKSRAQFIRMLGEAVSLLNARNNGSEVVGGVLRLRRE